MKRNRYLTLTPEIGAQWGLDGLYLTRKTGPLPPRHCVSISLSRKQFWHLVFFVTFG